MADRFCGRCGAKSSPRIPRSQQANGEMWCAMCVQNQGRQVMGAVQHDRMARLIAKGWSPRDAQGYHVHTAAVRVLADGRIAVASKLGNGRICVVAHDSGDGETIFHCPFCGSGQVIARSDGTTECEFCSTAFTVQVQPQMPAFPQTIDGVPVDVPGMPAGGQNANVPPGGPQDPNALPPGEEGDDEGFPPEEDDAEDGGSAPPPFQKGSFRTRTGARLTGPQYVRHLALEHSSNPERVLEQIRHENGAN